MRTELTNPRPSRAASTIPAVMASTLNWDMSFGTQIELEKVGTFVEIMSRRERERERKGESKKEKRKRERHKFGRSRFLRLSLWILSNVFEGSKKD